MNLHQHEKNQLSLSIISSIQLVTRVVTTKHTHPNIFLSTFNFWYQHTKNTKVDYLLTLF